MRKLALFLLALFCFGPQFYFGFAGTGLLTPLGWSLGTAMFAVGTGWRAPNRNIPISVAIGTVYAAAANVPLYLIGAWLGNPAAASIGLTATACATGLLLFGILTLMRRKWPQETSRTDVTPAEKSDGKAAPDYVPQKLHRLLDNERTQNERLIEPYRSKVQGGVSCDEIADAPGEFGRDPRNPIPVNGPMGEIIYLSNLRTADSRYLMFHRLGSISNVNIYETVSLDGAIWDIFFLHQFHPRKSRRSPSGYQIAAGADRNRLLLGVNEFVTAFPDHLADEIATMSEQIFKLRVRPQHVDAALARAVFERPTEHLARLGVVLDALKRAQS